MQKLSNFFVEKARFELGENESRVAQSMFQFKEWLAKHPFITYHQIGEFQIILIIFMYFLKIN